ncbi:unnamed protein product [Mytilus edulis]|uniref:Uncharacterized protein n=1 Tax=Mytilus edulis TaxID=6550 RepID=A0A8S3SY47_MYTED|nr:unnamed protein product [Mytilus edulis]
MQWKSKSTLAVQKTDSGGECPFGEPFLNSTFCKFCERTKYGYRCEGKCCRENERCDILQGCLGPISTVSEHKTVNDKLTSDTQNVETTEQDVNEDRHHYEEIDESFILQNDNNFPINHNAGSDGNRDEISQYTMDLPNHNTSFVTIAVGNNENNEYENVQGTDTNRIDGASLHLYERLQGQNNPNDGYSTCQAEQNGYETETEYAAIVGEYNICFYKTEH